MKKTTLILLVITGFLMFGCQNGNLFSPLAGKDPRNDKEKAQDYVNNADYQDAINACNSYIAANNWSNIGETSNGILVHKFKDSAEANDYYDTIKCKIEATAGAHNLELFRCINVTMDTLEKDSKDGSNGKGLFDVLDLLGLNESAIKTLYADMEKINISSNAGTGFGKFPNSTSGAIEFLQKYKNYNNLSTQNKKKELDNGFPFIFTTIRLLHDVHYVKKIFMNANYQADGIKAIQARLNKEIVLGKKPYEIIENFCDDLTGDINNVLKDAYDTTDITKKIEKAKDVVEPLRDAIDVNPNELTPKNVDDIVKAFKFQESQGGSN